MNKNRTTVLIIIFLVLLFTLPMLLVLKPETKYVEFVQDNNNKIVYVEIADTPEKMTLGLMYRTYLEGGMLFVFTEEQVTSFWMKNTLIPLEMIFIDKNLEIVNIRSAEPCKQDPCPNYSSVKPVLYVLEVNKGFVQENNIKVGDQINIHGYSINN